MDNPIRYDDPEGDCPWCVVAGVVWGVYEVGSQLYDTYDAYKTVTNPNASTGEKAIAVTGVVVDLVAPGGGYGTVLNKADDVVHAVKNVDKAKDAAHVADKASSLKKSAEIGQEAHRQIQKELKTIDPKIRTEVNVKLNNKVVRKDFVRPDGTKGIIKPNTPSGQKSAIAREKLMQQNGHKTETILYNPKDPKYLPGSPSYIGPKNKNK